jgi:RHS repeat-associated protein
VALTDNHGTPKGSYTYDAFGNDAPPEPPAPPSSVTNPFRYTGRELDSETGLYYYRARYYDAATGRFLSEDPTGLRSGVNFYAYTANDPINRTDPTGLKECDCTKASPLPASSPICDSYGNETYLGVSLKCFCKCAGDSAWSQKVRGWLACEHDKGTNPYAAHETCYRAAGLPSAPWLTLSKCYSKCFVGFEGETGTAPTGGGGAW